MSCETVSLTDGALVAVSTKADHLSRGGRWSLTPLVMWLSQIRTTVLGPLQRGGSSLQQGIQTLLSVLVPLSVAVLINNDAFPASSRSQSFDQSSVVL
jgi:hypothetical protein